MLATPAAAVATAVSAWFALALLRRAAPRGRAGGALWWWGVALAMFAVASAGLLVGTAAGWSAATFRAFYLFGALLNVPWLAMGSIEVNLRSQLVTRITGGAVLVVGALFLPGALGGDADLTLVGALLGLSWGLLLLVAHPGVVRFGAAAVLALFTVGAVVAVVTADLLAALPATGFPSGRGLFPESVRAYAVGGNAVASILVIVSALASTAVMVWRPPAAEAGERLREEARRAPIEALARFLFAGRRGAPGVAHLVRGNTLIAVGVLIAGASTTISDPTWHAVGIAAGVVVMERGFTRTTRPDAAVVGAREEDRDRPSTGPG